MMKLTDFRNMSNAEPIEGALEKVLAMNPVEYELNSGFGFKPRMTAVPAQDLETIPGATQRDGIGMVSADETALIPHLVAAIKELAARVEALEAKPTRRTVKKEASAE